MWFVSTIHRATRIVNPITWWVNSEGVGILALMMFLTAADVTGRYVFNRPILGSYEISEHMMAILVAFTIAYCAVQRGHVNVDLVISRLPQRTRAILRTFTDLLSLGLFSLIAWQSLYQAKVQYFAGTTSPSLFFPVFPFIIITGLGFGLLSLVVLIQFFESLSQAVGKWNQLP